MDTEVKQRICGLLGGLAYVSTSDYYNQMNHLVGKALPGHGSRIHLVSLDLSPYVKLLNKGVLSDTIEFLLQGVQQLVKTGIDFLVICSNTAHLVAPSINKFYPDLVLLHISDAVAFEIKKKKFQKIGFLGTKFSMLSNSCVVERLTQHGLTVVFPYKDEIERIHEVIIEELSNNIFTEESKQFYIKTMQRIYDEQQVEGIVLGCTEIPQLVKQNDIPHLPLFDSTKLHVEYAVDYQLGRLDIDVFLPPKVKENN